MKMRKNIVSVLAMLLALLLTVGSFGAAFAETAATTKPLSELTQEDIDYLRSLLVTEDGPLMGEELLAHINSFTGEELYWTLAAVSDEQYASLQEILTEEELIALFAPLHESDGSLPRNYTYVAPLMEYDTGVYALAAAAETGDGNQSETAGLYLNKSATFDPDNYTGEIALEAYVEGAVSSTTTVTPCDIVLVLDVSSSMVRSSFSAEIYAGSLDTTETYYVKSYGNYYAVTYDSETGTWKYVNGGTAVTPMESADDSDGNHVQFYISSSGNRLDGLKYAARTFVKNVAKNAADTGADHRISIVTFSGSASTKVTLANGSVKTQESTLLSTISGLSYSTGTNPGDGLSNAKTVLNSARDGSSRVVVFFTDGAPSRGGSGYNHTHSSYTEGSDSGFVASSADYAVDMAYDLKNASGAYKATIYSIGVFDNADPSDTTKYVENLYMHRVSSNCTEDTNCFQKGAISQNGYYQSASDAATLTKIFDNISDTVISGASSIKLDETTVITDTISPTFELPEGTTADDIEVYTADSNEDGSFDTPVLFEDANVTVDGKTVTVTNFDFQANYVGDHVASDGSTTVWGGKKLIIKIPFEPTAGYFGGNELATNTNAKITNGDFTEEFGAPTVDVPLRYEIAAQDQSIYLSNTADLSTIMQYVTNAPSTYECDNGSIDYVPNGTNNADVNIVYTLKDPDGNSVATLTIPAKTAASACSWSWTDKQNPVLYADAEYTVSCTVTPVPTGTYPAIEKTATGSVYVYKPQVTANDKTVDYGANVDLNTCVVDDIVWTHPQHGSIPAPANEPNATLQFSVTGQNITAETPVDITVALLDADEATVLFDFTTYTTFVRNATPCDFEACGNEDTTTHPGDSEACEFVLHLGTIDLYVKKTVSGNMANINKKFTFTATLKNAEGEVIAQATSFELAHNETVELEKLPIGATLEIVEANDGYTTTIGDEASANATYTAVIAADDADTTITFNNHKEAVIDTGVSLDSLPYILLLAVAAAGAVFFAVRRKRRED